MEDELIKNIIDILVSEESSDEGWGGTHKGISPESYDDVAQAILTLIRNNQSEAFGNGYEAGHKVGRAEIEKELMAELRDPCGTIWEHAKRVQDENDRLKQQLKEVEDGKT